MSSGAPAIGQPIVDLRDYTRAIWSRRGLVAAVTFLIAAAVLMWTLLQSPTYSAQAKVLVLPAQDPSLQETTVPPSQLTAAMATEAELVRSQAVASRAAAALGLEGSTDALVKGLRITSVTDTNILNIGYSSRDPATAARAANAFARAYIDVRTEGRVDRIRQALAPVTAELAETKDKISRLEAKIRAKPGKEPLLESKRSDLRSKLPILEGRVLELQSAASVNRAGELVSAASPPRSPSSPNFVFNLAAGLVGGFVLGCLIALIRNAGDTRIRSRQELGLRVGAPVLAVIPRVDGWLRFSRPPITVTASEPRSPVSEAYGGLAATLRHGGAPTKPRVVTVTSARPGEGKSATAANLAVAMAQIGEAVVVVSGDLRRPRIHEFFDLDNDKGLTDAISGSMPLPNVIAQTTVSNLALIPSGPSPKVPASFLARLAASNILAELHELYEIVIIDAPPVLPVADAAVLAAMSDGVLFVYDPAISSGEAVAEARDRLEGSGGTIIGAVLNNVVIDGRAAYSYDGGTYPDLGADGSR
jgi:tyrosine-protein kinase